VKLDGRDTFEFIAAFVICVASCALPSGAKVTTLADKVSEAINCPSGRFDAKSRGGPASLGFDDKARALALIRTHSPGRNFIIVEPIDGIPKSSAEPSMTIEGRPSNFALSKMEAVSYW
jgi:hypothetical protein